MQKTDNLTEKLTAILKEEFPEETVDVTLSGIRDNVHIVVVSRRFDEMSEKQKQDYLWSLIDKSGLLHEEVVRISMILPISPAELR